MFRLFSSVLCALIMLVAQPSRASLLFEPYAGYAIGDYKFTGASTNPDTSLQDKDFTGNIDGFAYGAKAGWSFGSIILGGEYQAIRAQKKLAGATQEVNWYNTSVFGIAGIQLGMGLRLFAGMTVMPHKSEESTTPESNIYTGSAQKISLGYHYKMPFALNVDYIIYKFDKVKQGNETTKIKDLMSKLNYTTLLFTLSFPFEI